MKKEHYGFIHGMCAALVSAVGAIFIKLCVEVPNETLVFARFFIAFLFILPGILFRKVQLHWKDFGKHITRAFTGIGAMYCYFYSVKYLPLVDAVTLLNTSPLFMPIVVFFWLKMVVPKARIAALLLGFVGVLVILRPGSGLGELALGIGLLGALFSALSSVGILQLSKHEATETILSYYFLISSVISFPPMVYAWKPIEEPILWLYLILIAVTSLAQQYFSVKSLTHAPATKVSTMSYLGVIFSGLFGWWFFAEVPNLIEVGGVALIILGGLLALLSKAESRKRKGYE